MVELHLLAKSDNSQNGKERHFNVCTLSVGIIHISGVVYIWGAISIFLPEPY